VFRLEGVEKREAFDEVEVEVKKFILDDAKYVSVILKS